MGLARGLCPLFVLSAHHVWCFYIALPLVHQLDVGLIKPAYSSLVPLGLWPHPECVFVFVSCLYSYIWLPSSYVVHTVLHILFLFFLPGNIYLV